MSDVVGRAHVDFDEDRIDLYDVSGDLSGRLGPVRSRHLHMSLAETRITVAGDVDLGRKPFSADLILLVPDELRAYFVSRDPTGSFTSRLSNIELTLVRPGGDRPLEVVDLSFKGEAVFENCSLERPVSLSEIEGRLDLTGEGSLAKSGKFHMRGRLHDVSLRAGVLTFQDLGADLFVTGDAVDVRNLGGPFAGGRLPPNRNRLRIETAPNGRVRGEIVIEDADLRHLASEVVQLPGDLGGLVSLEFEIDGRGESLATLGGEGTVTIEDGELWELPLFAALYEFSLGLVFGAEDLPTFEKGTINFRLAEGMLILDWFELRAPLALTPVGLTVTGDGVVGPTGVDLRVVPQVISIKLPLISDAIRLLKRGLINYRIFGPLQNPRVAYWNAAVDVMAPNQDVTRLPRLAPRKPADWTRKF